MMPAGWYVYALLDRPVRLPRLRAPRLELIEADGVHAVVERRTRRPPVSERQLRRQHDIVVRLADRAQAILPVRFGALVTEEEIRQVVRLRRPLLKEGFAAVRRRQQMTVRIRMAAPTAVPRNQAAERAGEGMRYLRRRAGLDLGGIAPALDSLRRAVKPIVAAERIHVPRNGAMLAVYHLVPRSRVERYRRAALNVLRESPDVTITGPWPPFAFTPEWWP